MYQVKIQSYLMNWRDILFLLIINGTFRKKKEEKEYLFSLIKELSNYTEILTERKKNNNKSVILL